MKQIQICLDLEMPQNIVRGVIISGADLVSGDVGVL